LFPLSRISILPEYYTLQKLEDYLIWIFLGRESFV